MLHRVVLTDGPLLRADASDLSTGDSLLAGGAIVSQPPQAVTLCPPTLRDLSARSVTYNMNLQLRKLSIVFLPEEALKDVSWQTTARDNVSSHPLSPGRRNHGSMVSRRRRHHSTCAHPTETLASARTAAQENRVRHNSFVERQRNGNSECAVASNKTVKNINVELGGVLVDLHQAQLRPRRLHVCVATQRRAVWTRGAVSTASCKPPN